jgi:hypothetical protein
MRARGGRRKPEKISRIIEECRYGIHDLSYVQIDPGTGLPRFNMPLELGLFLGCKRFGGRSQRQKACLILDRRPFRYRLSLSDIAGQDVHAYNGKAAEVILKIRDWLRVSSRRTGLPGGSEVLLRYRRFQRDLPKICAQLKREPAELTFADYSETAEYWIIRNR